jgi:hypothetical protein
LWQFPIKHVQHLPHMIFLLHPRCGVNASCSFGSLICRTHNRAL